MGQHSSQGDGGVGLPSSGGDALPMAKVPCEFRVDRPTFIFQGKVEIRGLAALACRGRWDVSGMEAPDVTWHIYSGQHSF